MMKHFLMLFLAFLICQLYIQNLLAQQTIQDIQQVDTLGNSGDSPLLGQVVTVEGIVTASLASDNLQALFIQQEGVAAWGGIELANGTQLTGLQVNDKVRVTGLVAEVNGFTVLENVMIDSVLGQGEIEPIELDPGIFAQYSIAQNERYEGMLIRLVSPDTQLYVVDVNPDGPSNNFGDWVIGTDPSQPTNGCRILTGIQRSGLTSSLNVSYINDIVWATNSGSLKVPAKVVTTDSTFQSVSGILTYKSSNLKLLPRNNQDFNDINSLTALQSPSVWLPHIQLAPNPIDAQSTLIIHLDVPTAFQIRVLDLSGKIVRDITPTQIWAAGTHTYPIGSISIASGIYLLELQGSHQWQRLKLIVP